MQYIEHAGQDFGAAGPIHRFCLGRVNPETRFRGSDVLYRVENIALHGDVERCRWLVGYQEIRVIPSMAEEAAELGIRTHDPVVQVRRIFLNRKREVLCLGNLVYRADRVRFDINLDLDDRNRVLELSGFPTS